MTAWTDAQLGSIDKTLGPLSIPVVGQIFLFSRGGVVEVYEAGPLVVFPP